MHNLYGIYSHRFIIYNMLLKHLLNIDSWFHVTATVYYKYNKITETFPQPFYQHSFIVNNFAIYDSVKMAIMYHKRFMKSTLPAHLSFRPYITNSC